MRMRIRHKRHFPITAHLGGGRLHSHTDVSSRHLRTHQSSEEVPCRPASLLASHSSVRCKLGFTALAPRRGHRAITRMTKKRRSNGRNKPANARGRVKRVRCEASGVLVPKDKAVKRFIVRNIVDASAVRDIQDASTLEGYALPKIYRKVYYSISAAIHSKIVRIRSMRDRRNRQPPPRFNPGAGDRDRARGDQPRPWNAMGDGIGQGGFGGARPTSPPQTQAPRGMAADSAFRGVPAAPRVSSTAEDNSGWGAAPPVALDSSGW